ncbi:MAG: HupE/UreJ family protein [Microscillaceae bacterium]|nr:HupE/UreJ family protein [Microscillaceae bacterium]
MKRLILFFALSILTLPAFAHEGHDSFNGYTVLHYLTSPLHLLSMVVIVTLAWAIVRYRNLKTQEVRK